MKQKMRKNWGFFVVFLGFLLLGGVSLAAEDLTETQDNAMATNLGLYGSHTWDIAVDPADNDYIYIATYYSPNGFFYSSDGGLTWQGLPNDVDHGSGRAVEVNPDNGHVYALLNDFLVSTDHGATYEVAYEFGASGASLLYTQDTLFIGTSDGEVVNSEDEGENFSLVTVCDGKAVWSLASSSDSLYALCYDYDTSVSTVFKSTDVGDTWTDLDIATDGITSAEKVAVNPATDDVFLVPSSLGGTLYRSDDGGSTWTALADAPNSGNIAFDSTGRIYIGWYYSDDEGVTWTSFGTGGNYNHLMVPDPTDDDILYDTSVPGFSKSTDQGATWTDSVEGITAAEVTSVSQATDKNIVWVATQNGPAKTENFLDEAPDWQYMPISENFMSSGYDAVWVKPDDSSILVTSSSQALHYSTDGGTTWTAATVDITLTGAVFQFVSDTDGTLYAVVGPNTSAGAQTGGVITSADNGATWTSLDFPDDGAARSIAIAADGDIFVGAHSSLGGVYKYDGTSWTKLDASDDYEYVAIVTDPEDADTVYALATKWPGDSGMGVYKSTDDGETWEQKATGFGDIDENFYEFNALTLQSSTGADTLYVSMVENGTLKGLVYKSSDAGENWDLYFTGKKGETFNTLLFDGLVAGNSRGIYDMKSRASLGLKASKKTVTLTLKDASTGKSLKNRQVKIYKKVGKAKKWKLFKTVKTNKQGKVSFKLSTKKKVKLYAKWSPRPKDQDEYAIATSKTVTIK